MNGSFRIEIASLCCLTLALHSTRRSRFCYKLCVTGAARVSANVKHTRVSTRPLYYILSLALLTIIACTSKTLAPVGGPYFIEYIKQESIISEPGGLRVHLIYKKNGKTVLLSESNGAFQNFYRRVYGPNLIFVEGHWLSSNAQLIAYSESHGKITVDEDLKRYWKIVVDDRGISLHRYQNGEKIADPNPQSYSTDYLTHL
jgi:hypothetical protein